MKHLIKITMTAAILTFTTATASALELKAGKYKHRFDDSTCGIFTVDANGNFSKYVYGPCGKSPTYTSNNVRLYGTTIRVGIVSMSKVQVTGRCFKGLWKFKQYRMPNQTFCR